jgi:hypothetical protein
MIQGKGIGLAILMQDGEFPLSQVVLSRSVGGTVWELFESWSRMTMR